MFEICMSNPCTGPEEPEAVSQAIEKTMLTQGESLFQFRTLLERKITRPVVLCSSGTAALHMALHVLGIGPGDEVIVPNISFISTINCVLYTGAVPVVCEVGDKEFELSINPSEAEKYITSNTRAIIVAHLFGSCGNLNKLVELAEDNGLALIEDASQCIGCEINGKALGTFGTIGTFSFNGNKIITTAGGGALTSLDPNIISRLEQIINQGKNPSDHLSHVEMGFNNKLSNIHAAIGVAQFNKLDKFIEKKKCINMFYNEHIDVLPIKIKSNYWLSVYITRKINAQDLYKKLKDLHIETRPLYIPFNRVEYLSKFCRNEYQVSDRLYKHLLCLPSDVNLTENQLRNVVAKIKEFDV